MGKCANMCGADCGGLCQECPTGMEIIEEKKEEKKNGKIQKKTSGN